MKYELHVSQRSDNLPSNILVKVHLYDWNQVVQILRWVHNRRLDFILSPDAEYGSGWVMEIEQDGVDYYTSEQIKDEMYDD